MTIHDKIRHTFRKHPECRFNRALTYWYIGADHYEFIENMAIKEDLIMFFRDFAGLERSVREILKEDEFKLPIEQEAKRLEKAKTYKEKYKK